MIPEKRPRGRSRGSVNKDELDKSANLDRTQSNLKSLDDMEEYMAVVGLHLRWLE
jgi:hypothetical protein